MIPPEKLDEIIAKTDIAALISQYVTLKRTGKSLKGLCPFHVEKTPSFNVNPDRGFYKCFGCGESGGAVQFLMKIEGLSFPDAVKTLADRAGVTITTTAAEKKAYSEKELLGKIISAAAKYYHETLINNPLGKDALAYLKKRGLSIKTIQGFQLGYAPEKGDYLISHLLSRGIKIEQIEKSGLARRGNYNHYDYFRGRVIYPICDSQGRCIGMGARALSDEAGPKYLNTPESPIFSKGKIVYGLHLAKPAIRTEEEVYVVEGYMDAIALFEAGISNVIASMGTSLTEEQARGIARYTNRVIFAYDADSAGAAATVRGIGIFEKAGLLVKVISMPQGEDPDSIIRKKGAGFFKEIAQRARSIIEYKIETLRKKLDLSTPEGKEQFVAEITPILKEVKGDIRQSEYIRKISEKFRINEEILRRSVGNKKARRRGIDITAVYKSRRLSPEEELIAHLLASPKLIPLCKKYSLDDRHMDKFLLNILRSLIEEDTSGMEAIRAEFLNRICTDELMLRKVIDLSMVEGLPPASEERILVILESIKNRETEQEIEDLIKKIAEGSATPEEVRKLTELKRSKDTIWRANLPAPENT